jgi:hypothetical protein
MKHVIVRSSQSGVWFGELAADAVADGPGTVRVVLERARRVHYWEGAGSCSGLAAQGPSGGRIASPVRAEVGGCCEVLDCTPAAVERYAAIPEWAP